MENSETRKTKGGVVHPRIERAIAKIGSDISRARRARKIAAEDFAQRIGVSRMTLHRLESGDPGISFNTLAMALHALGRLDALSSIADPVNDHVTMMQMDDQVPRRVSRSRVVRSPDGDEEDEFTAAPPPSNKFKGF
jgi:transcriptional regulator with XRE-family HTH domain